jgi:hypothetical protein
MVGLASTCSEYAVAGLQGCGLNNVALWPSLLDDGNWSMRLASKHDGQTGAHRFTRI